MANLAGWPYWKVISITGQAGSGTDYQVRLEIGDSAGGDLHLEGHCTNFPQDIRITDDDGTTLLDHFVEDITADPIVVQIEVKDDLGSNRDIRVYYGKSGETTASNITNTFPDFSDDFPGSSLDLSKWDETGTVVVASSICTIDGTDILNTDLQNFGTDTSVRFKMKMDQYTLISLTGYWDKATESNRAMFYSDRGNSNQYSTQSAAAGSSTQLDLGTGYTGWHTWEVKRNGSSSHIFEIDNANVGTVNNNITSSDMGLVLYSTSGVTIEVDWAVIKKYNSPEPAFSSAGAEQTPGVGAAPTGVFYGPLVGPFGGPI